MGVIGIACPDESPLLAFVSLFAPTVVRGNTIIIVPSEKYPLSATDLYQVRRGVGEDILLSYNTISTKYSFLIVIHTTFLVSTRMDLKIATAVGSKVSGYCCTHSLCTQVFDTSDLPGGVVNIVTGSRDHLTKFLTEHQDVEAMW